jgi:hypothetical protein
LKSSRQLAPEADTVNTIRALAKLGIPRSKIHLVFNKVEVDESVADEFSAPFRFAEPENSFTLREDAVIYSNEIFERIKAVGKSLFIAISRLRRNVRGQ